MADHPASESRWPSVVAVLVAVALSSSLPSTMSTASAFPPLLEVGLPLLALALLVPLTVAAPHRHVGESGRRRKLAIALTAMLSAANLVALALLVHQLFQSRIAGSHLLLAAGQVWATNVIAFALWYWELDGGGPPRRLADRDAPRDFAFVQMTAPSVAVRGWKPRFVDYLYLSFTNASAFSAADTVPLTSLAKLLMLAQSVISIVTVILVAARAVNMVG
jgi:uncharacterized membrane protein